MKSGRPVRAFSVAMLLLLVSASLSAQTKSPTKSNTWLRGTWEGTGYQIDDQSTWAMRLTTRGHKFSIEYPSLSCGGRWRLISINGYRARFRERLDHGQDKCTDNGAVVIQRISRRQVLFLYSLTGKREVTASAVLNRKP